VSGEGAKILRAKNFALTVEKRLTASDTMSTIKMITLPFWKQGDPMP
jgi:hypothetical protein